MKSKRTKKSQPTSTEQEAEFQFEEWARRAPTFSTKAMRETAKSHFIGGFILGVQRAAKLYEDRMYKCDEIIKRLKPCYIIESPLAQP